MPAYRKRAEEIRKQIEKDAAARRGPPVRDPAAIEQSVRIRMKPGEFDHVLAGLRMLEATERSLGAQGLPGKIRDIATNGGTRPLLDPDEIDALCEAINTGGRDIR